MLKRAERDNATEEIPYQPVKRTSSKGVWDMLSSVVELLFGCLHRNYSFPITARGKRRTGAAAATGTYIVCLDCGKEFAYDWQQMKVVSGSQERELAPHVSPLPENARSLVKVA